MSRSVLFVTFVGGSRDPSRTLFLAVRTSSRDVSRSVLGSRFAAVFVFVCGPRDSSRAVVSFATGRGVCNLVVCIATTRGQCFFLHGPAVATILFARTGRGACVSGTQSVGECGPGAVEGREHRHRTP